MPPVSLAKKWLDAPDGFKICLRPLSSSEKSLARRIRSEADTAYAMKLSASVGDVREAVASAMKDEDVAERRALAAEKSADDTNPDNFDEETILCGIVDWDYKYDDGTPYPCDADTRTTLDDTVTAWAVAQILAMSARTPGNAPSSAKSSVTGSSRRS